MPGFYSSSDDITGREFYVGDSGTLPKVGDVVKCLNLKTGTTVIGKVIKVDKRKMVYMCEEDMFALL